MLTDFPKQGDNTGVLDAAPPVDGWVAGGETGIGATPVLETTGQFDAYLPDDEAQWLSSPFFDTSACVTFSALNNIEIILNRMRAKSLLPGTHETFLQSAGYINPNTNKVNFSDRYTAKMSGTTTQGNNIGYVGESIRKLNGLLPEKDWPFPKTLGSLPDTTTKWQQYYAPIDTTLQAKAMRFLDYFTISYQWITVGTTDKTKMTAALKNGPLQIVSEVCTPWNADQADPPIQGCGCGTSHATTMYGYKADGSWKDYDSYKSYTKYLATNYCIPYAVQFYVVPKTVVAPPGFHYVFNTNLKYGAPTGPEVHKLQEALQYLRGNNGLPYMSAGVFGPYGPTTKGAVGRFQLDRGITDPDGAGTNFGPQSRVAMNALVK